VEDDYLGEFHIATEIKLQPYEKCSLSPAYYFSCEVVSRFFLHRTFKFI